MTDPLVHELYLRGRETWGALPLAHTTFEMAVAEHARRAGVTAPLVAPEHAADFYLALACAEGLPGAAEAFRRTVLVHVASYVGSRAPADDVEQLVAMRLLVRDGDTPPRIAEYSGTGALGAFVRVVATRIVLNSAGVPGDKVSAQS